MKGKNDGSEQTTMWNFLTKGRGRPKKREGDKEKPKRGRPPNIKKDPPQETHSNNAGKTPSAKSPPVAAVSSKPNGKQEKKTRMNWGKGEGLARLTKAVNDWANGSDECFRGGSGKRMPFTDYAATIDIPFNTLRKFLSQDGKRLKELG
jgi:hypothetical protein